LLEQFTSSWTRFVLLFLMMPHLSCLAVLATVSHVTCSPDPTIPKTMRAVLLTGEVQKEGDFSKVKLVNDQPVPRPGTGQVLVKVSASSVNPIDWKILTPPFYPGPKVMGFDMAGTVVEVGLGCKRLKVGDEVWADLGKGLGSAGLQLGAWADYAVADESQVGLKPSSLDFKSAASLPLVALTDYQVYKKAGSPWIGRQNLTVVVTSGSGGTGIPAIQLAKAYNASHIITAASAKNSALLRSLGATMVVDYHKSSIWDVVAQDSVDIVYDNYGAPGTADAAMPALRSGGVYVFLPGKNGDISKHPKAGVSQFNFGIVDPSHHEDLDVLAKFANEGSLKAVLSETFSLDDVVSALNMSSTGHVVGKVSIDMTEKLVRHSIVV